MTLDDRLTITEQNCMRVREAPIDGEILAVSITHQINESKKAILSDLLEIIGEDEPVKGNPFDKSFYTTRNQIRQELRDKVKEYCK